MLLDWRTSHSPPSLSASLPSGSPVSLVLLVLLPTPSLIQSDEPVCEDTWPAVKFKVKLLIVIHISDLSDLPNIQQTESNIHTQM